jgi:hypothetical protein
MKKTALLPTTAVWAGLAAWALFSTGCATQRDTRDLMAEELNKAEERPVAMRGEGTFAEGKLHALATVSRGFNRSGRGGPRPANAGRKRGWLNDEDEYPTYFGDSDEEQKEAYEQYMRVLKAERARGSPMPPVTLRVALENKGAEPVEVEVMEVNSELGNFAVRPSKLTIAPGQEGVLEPMISQLGVTSDEIPLKLAVRVGGKTETQVVTVKNVLAASLRK